MSAHGVSRWTRFLVGAQVGLGALLAVAAALLAIEVAEWWYVRVDLSLTGRNTLDRETEELVARLPEPVRVDVFLRPLSQPYEGVRAEIEGRLLELLLTARNAHRDKLEVEVYDARQLERVQSRQSQLGVEGTNVAVVSCGKRTSTLELFGDVAVVDWGNPTEAGYRYLLDLGLGGQVDYTRWNPNPNAFRGPALSQFNGGEALARALLKVTSGEAPRVYFSVGHGEVDPDGASEDNVLALRRALENDGFEVGRWNGLDEGSVPPDADVLVTVGADQPFAERELEAIEAFVRAGGRLVAAPSIEEVIQGRRNGIVDLLAAFYVNSERGVLCQEIKNAMGQARDGDPSCALLAIGENGLSASHPLTEPLRRRGRRVYFGNAFPLVRGNPIAGWTTFAIVNSPRESWLDLLDANGAPDFRFDPTREARAARGLCLLSQGPSVVQAPGEQIRGARVLALSSDLLFMDDSFDANRDFLLSAFNWIAERDFRVGVTQRTIERTLLDVQHGSAYTVLAGSVWFGLPALFAAIGLGVAVRRRKG